MNATPELDPTPTPPHPQPHPPTLGQRAAHAVLRAFGWRVDIRWPTAPRCVIIVYPHTSNWDFVWGLLARFAAGLPIQFIGKHTLFRWPFGALMRRMGGIPVNRADAAGFIPRLAEAMRARPWTWIAMAPEGTRKYTDHLKSGFYRLARTVDAPIGLAFLDYAQRRIALTEFVWMTGDEEADLAGLRAFYADKVGKRPEHASAFRFR